MDAGDEAAPPLIGLLRIGALARRDPNDPRQRARGTRASTPGRSARSPSPSLRWQVLRRDESTCQLCGAKAPQVPVEVDHVVPWSKGGPTVVENLRVLCFACNRGKSNRSE